jgi:hypothetical protein
MPIPADMEQVNIIIETKYVEMVRDIAEELRAKPSTERLRISRSRMFRNLIIEALRCRGIVQDSSETQDIAA